MWLGWETLTRERLEQIEKDDFERLVAALVRLEASDRWGTTFGIVEGPSPPGPDGGLDLLVTFPKPPALRGTRRLPDTHSLLPGVDKAPSLAISCKSGKNFLKTQLAEAKTQSERVVEVLAAGGHLLLLANASASRLIKPLPATSRHDTCRSLLADAYATRNALKPLGSKALFDQIHLVDSDDLLSLLKAWRPHELDILEPELSRRLGLRSFPFLVTAAQWRTDQTEQRGAPDFHDDEVRAALRTRLGAWITDDAAAAQQARALHGAPGVGKTRLVLEVLKACDASARAVFSDDPSALGEALRDEGLVARCPGTVFVLDDCPAHRAESVLVAFRRAIADAPDAASRLLVVVPEAASPDLQEKAYWVTVDTLPPLHQDASRALVQEVLGGADSSEVDRVTRLTEGFPRFAVLVAREVRGGATLPHTTTDAARYALAANNERSAQCVNDRARALLGVTLLRRRKWRDVDDATRDAVACAMGLRDRHDWDQNLSACQQRGLLRDGPHWYVTPGVLVREAWRIVNDPGDPKGPPGPRILRECPDLLEDLLEHLGKVGIDAEELAALSRALLTHLQSTAPHLGALPLPGLFTALLHAARHAPEALLDALEGWLLRADPEALAQAERARNPFTLSLRALLRPGDHFDRIERLLFVLARHDTETHIGNARDAWTWLVMDGLNSTLVERSALEAHVATLAWRCAEGPSPARVVAVELLARLIAPHAEQPRAGDPRPFRVADVAHGLDACWALILDHAHDVDPAVRAAASRVLVERIADRLRSPGLDPLADKLLVATSGLPDPMRHQLRENLQHGRIAEVHEALRDRVLRETAPRDYAARLREFARDFRHTPESLRDHPLLLEGLEPTALPLADALAVLCAPESRAANSVMIAAGRLDADERLRDALVRFTRHEGDERPLTSWCLGQRDAGRGDRVRAMVADWHDAHDEALDRATLRIAVSWGLDDAWVPLVLEVLRRHDNAAALRLVDLGDWVNLSAPWRVTLARWLLDRPAAEGVGIVLGKYALAKFALDPSEHTLLVEAMRRCTPALLRGHGAWAFHQVGIRLLETPAAAEVCEAAVQGIGDDAVHADREVWLLVADAAAAAPDALWTALSRVLSARDTVDLRYAIGLYPIVNHLPTPAIMAWAGEDERRAIHLTEMVRFETNTLPDLAAALLERHGPASPVARALARRLGQRPPMVQQHPLDFLAARHALCRAWSTDPRPKVARWAALQAADFAHTLQQETVAEALRRTGS